MGNLNRLDIAVLLLQYRFLFPWGPASRNRKSLIFRSLGVLFLSEPDLGNSGVGSGARLTR